MYTKTNFSAAGMVLRGAIVACTLCAGTIEARDVTIDYKVSAQGLDLRQPAGAHQFYGRLQHAARVVCTDGNRVDLQASPNPDACYEKALAAAIRIAHAPLLTQLYLEAHTLRDAGAHGIESPIHVAAQ